MKPGDKADVDAFMAQLRVEEAAQALADARAAAPNVRTLSPQDYAKAEAAFLQSAVSAELGHLNPGRGQQRQASQPGRLKHISEMTPEEFAWAESALLRGEVIPFDPSRRGSR